MADDSFALPEQRATFSQEVAAPVAARGGLIGGSISGGLQLRDPSRDTPTAMDQLFKFALKVGDQKIAEAEARQKDKKFIEGVSRAAAGEAAKDIEASQPWYARMFGSGDVLAGARAYEGMTDANHMEAGVLEQMQNIRSLPPERAQAAILDIHRGMASEDPVREAARNATFIKGLPGMMKLYAKSHIAYQQEVATEEQRKGIQAVFNRMEMQDGAARKLGDPDEADETARLAELKMMHARIPENFNPVTYRAQLVEGYANSLAAGQFSAYTLARKNKLLDDLPPQHQRQLAALHDAQASKRASALAGPDLNARVNLAAAGDLGEAATEAELDAINEEFMKKTGMDFPLVPTAKYQTLMQRAIRKDHAKAAEELRKAERAESQAERDAARVAEKRAAEAVKEADKRALIEAGQSMATAALDSPDTNSVVAFRDEQQGHPAYRIAKTHLMELAGERWQNPLTEDQRRVIAGLPEGQREAQTRAQEALNRSALLKKTGLGLDRIQADIAADLNTGNYEAASRVVDALAFGAEGAGMKELPSNFVKLIPENKRAFMSAYVVELGAMKPDKNGQYDRAAAWAAAEERTRFSVKKAAGPKDTAAIRAALVDESDGNAVGWGKNPDLHKTQAGELLIREATLAFDGRVSQGALTPQAVAIASAKNNIEVLGGSGVAYIRNPQSPTIVSGYQDDKRMNQPSPYQDKLTTKHLLSSPDRLGNALKEAINSRPGWAFDNKTVIYRADDPKSGRPYFVVVGQVGQIEAITLRDLEEASDRYQSRNAPAVAVAEPVVAP